MSEIHIQRRAAFYLAHGALAGDGAAACSNGIIPTIGCGSHEGAPGSPRRSSLMPAAAEKSGMGRVVVEVRGLPRFLFMPAESHYSLPTDRP